MRSLRMCLLLALLLMQGLFAGAQTAEPAGKHHNGAGNSDVELALNLVWLVLAAASFLFGMMQASAYRRRYSHFATATALICIICFLFPVISISDDLINSPALGEASKSKGNVSTDDSTHTPLASELVPLLYQGSALGRAAHWFEEVPVSREQVWFNLDRRPPPQRS